MVLGSRNTEMATLSYTEILPFWGQDLVESRTKYAPSFLPLFYYLRPGSIGRGTGYDINFTGDIGSFQASERHLSMCFI